MKLLKALVWFLIISSQYSHGFLISPIKSLQTTRSAIRRQETSLSVARVFNETEPLSLETTIDPEQRITKAGSVAKHAADDELDFKRVKDSKFLERNKRWVVLVDDEESIRLAVGDYLYDEGYQVTACADADAFLAVCQKSSDGASPQPVPDAIISDIRMPGKDGLELLGLIRSDERLSRVPVILLTAKGMAADRIAGFKAGANVYLPKPFAPEELLSVLDNSIQRRQQMTNRKSGSLVDLKQEMAGIKEIMKKNADRVVQKTNVYLTLMEREVLELLCQGYTNKEIAEERGVNIMGVHKVIQKLYKVTETETRTQLVRWAMKTGYVAKR
jgi:DNA-binding NarL/FixJ family response regulator